ncbi:MAG TPA: efflux RND transporter periplasmic adaptor subunit [Polyangia bacterium]|nr:efflux RND transporter periplasmic adaptor subunit [Polyangia bacterium]
MTANLASHHDLSLTLAALLCAAAAPGCSRAVEAHAEAADQRPQVTVAQPVAEAVTEFSEHTGRAESPESVEIRPRVGGAIVKANFREGDLVKKGALLFVIDPRPFEVALARAKAELAGVRADHELARKNLDRAQQLMDAHAIPTRDYDVQKAQQDQLAAREDMATAAIRAAELDLEYAYIRSPIDGRIGRKLVTEGNLVGPTTPSPLATVVSVDPLYVYVELEEARGLELDRKQSLRAEIGFAGEDGYPRPARVDFIDNHVETGSGTVKVRAVIPNHDGRLTPGLFARVRIPRGGAHDALLVADRAIATDQEHRFVWVVDGEQKIQYRAVTLGPISDGLRVVRTGLTPTDRVLVRGLQRARAGVAVVADVVPMRATDSAAKSN